MPDNSDNGTILAEGEEGYIDPAIVKDGNIPLKPISSSKPIDRKSPSKPSIPKAKPLGEVFEPVKPETAIPPDNFSETAGDDGIVPEPEEEEEEQDDFVQRLDPINGWSVNGQLDHFVSVPPLMAYANAHHPNDPTREEVRNADFLKNQNNERMPSFLEELANTENGEFFRLISADHKGSNKMLRNALSPSSRQATQKDWQKIMDQPGNERGLTRAFSPSMFGMPELGANGKSARARRWLAWLGHKDKNFKYFGNKDLKEYHREEPQDKEDGASNIQPTFQKDQPAIIPLVLNTSPNATLNIGNPQKPAKENPNLYFDELRHAETSKEAALAIFKRVAYKKGIELSDEQAANAVDWIRKNLGASIQKTLQQEEEQNQNEDNEDKPNKKQNQDTVVSKSGKEILQGALQQPLFVTGLTDRLNDNKFVTISDRIFNHARKNGKTSLSRDEIVSQVASDFLDDYSQNKDEDSLYQVYNIVKKTGKKHTKKYNRVINQIKKISDDANIVATAEDITQLSLQTVDDAKKYSQFHLQQCQDNIKKLKQKLDMQIATKDMANPGVWNMSPKEADKNYGIVDLKKKIREAEAQREKLLENDKKLSKQESPNLDKENNIYKACLALYAEGKLNTPPDNEISTALTNLKQSLGTINTVEPKDKDDKKKSLTEKIQDIHKNFNTLRGHSAHKQDLGKQFITNKAATFAGKELLDQLAKEDEQQLETLLNECAGKGNEPGSQAALTKYLKSFNNNMNKINELGPVDELNKPNPAVKNDDKYPKLCEQEDIDTRAQLILQLQQCKEPSKQKQLITQIKSLQGNIVTKASEKFVASASQIEKTYHDYKTYCDYNGGDYVWNNLHDNINGAIKYNDIKDEVILGPTVQDRVDHVRPKTLELLKKADFVQNIANQIEKERTVRDFRRSIDSLGRQASSFSHGKLVNSEISETNLDTAFASAIDKMLQSDETHGGGNIFKLLSKKYRDKDDSEWQQRLEKPANESDVFDNGKRDRFTNFIDLKSDAYSKNSIEKASTELCKYLREASPLFADVSDAEASELLIKYILPTLRGGIGPGKPNYIGPDKNAVNSLRNVIRQTLRNPGFVHRVVEKSALGRRVGQQLHLQNINAVFKDKHWYNRFSNNEKLTKKLAHDIRATELQTNDHCVGIVQVAGGIEDSKEYQRDRLWAVFENTDKNSTMETCLAERYADDPINQQVFGKQRSSIYREYNRSTAQPTGKVMVSVENDVLTAFNNGVLKVHDPDTFKEMLKRGGLSFDAKVTEKKGIVNYEENEHIILGKDGAEVTIQMGFEKVEGNNVNKGQNQVTNLMGPNNEKIELKFNKEDTKAFRDYFEPQRELSVTDSEVDHHKYYTEFQELWNKVDNICNDHKSEEEEDLTTSLIAEINDKAKQLETQGFKEEANHLKKQVKLIKPLKEYCRQTRKCKTYLQTKKDKDPTGLDKGPLEKMCAKIPFIFQEQIYNVFMGDGMRIAQEIQEEKDIGHHKGGREDAPTPPPTPPTPPKIPKSTGSGRSSFL